MHSKHFILSDEDQKEELGTPLSDDEMAENNSSVTEDLQKNSSGISKKKDNRMKNDKATI